MFWYWKAMMYLAVLLTPLRLKITSSTLVHLCSLAFNQGVLKQTLLHKCLMHWVNQFHVQLMIHGWCTYLKVNSCLALAQLIFSRIYRHTLVQTLNKNGESFSMQYFHYLQLLWHFLLYPLEVIGVFFQLLLLDMDLHC